MTVPAIRAELQPLAAMAATLERDGLVELERTVRLAVTPPARTPAERRVAELGYLADLLCTHGNREPGQLARHLQAMAPAEQRVLVGRRRIVRLLDQMPAALVDRVVYDELKPEGVPSSDWLVDRYGSWKRACRAADGLLADGRTTGALPRSGAAGLGLGAEPVDPGRQPGGDLAALVVLALSGVVDRTGVDVDVGVLAFVAHRGLILEERVVAGGQDTLGNQVLRPVGPLGRLGDDAQARGELAGVVDEVADELVVALEGGVQDLGVVAVVGLLGVVVGLELRAAVGSVVLGEGLLELIAAPVDGDQQLLDRVEEILVAGLPAVGCHAPAPLRRSIASLACRLVRARSSRAARPMRAARRRSSSQRPVRSVSGRPSRSTARSSDGLRWAAAASMSCTGRPTRRSRRRPMASRFAPGRNQTRMSTSESGPASPRATDPKSTAHSTECSTRRPARSAEISAQYRRT